jgi:hypothetical protein
MCVLKGGGRGELFFAYCLLSSVGLPKDFALLVWMHSRGQSYNQSYVCLCALW